MLEKLEISIKNDEKENKSFDEKSKKIQKEFDDLTKDIEKATGIFFSDLSPTWYKLNSTI